VGMYEFQNERLTPQFIKDFNVAGWLSGRLSMTQTERFE
jgi:hypothetical protein